MCCHFIVTDLFFYFPLFTASIYVIFCLRWKLDLPKFLFFHSILSRFQLSATCHVIYCPFKAVPYLFHDLPEVLLNQQKPWKRLTTTHTHLSAYTQFFSSLLYFLLSLFLFCLLETQCVCHLSPQAFLVNSIVLWSFLNCNASYSGADASCLLLLWSLQVF